MAEKDTYVHHNFNKQEIRNFSIEKLAAHPTGPDLYEGRAWQLTTDDHVYHYSGGVIRQIANIDDLNKFGELLGGHDASGGLIPTQGSGVNEVGSSDLSIEAGDSWRITTAGTIVGLGSGDDDLEVGDLLIALIDGASTAGDFMAIEMNLPDTYLDEVQNFVNVAAFPGTGEVGVIYIANDTDEAYLWDGAAYKALSLPNLQHEVTLGGFPGTGESDILYIADDTDLVYFWDGVAYIPVSGVFSNFYSIDGTLISNRTVIGGGKNLTYTDILGFTISTATYSITTAGAFTETIGGNKSVNAFGSSSESSAGKTITSTGAGNNITLATNPDGAFIVPSSANPDGDVSAPLSGMIKYDTTDGEFRFYENGAWRTFNGISNLAEALAGGDATGANDINIDEGQKIVYNTAAGGPYTGELINDTLTGNHTWELPNLTGIIALASQLTGDGMYDGSGIAPTVTVVTVTDTLTFDDGTVVIQGGSGTDIFELKDDGGVTSYLKMDSTGLITLTGEDFIKWNGGSGRFDMGDPIRQFRILGTKLFTDTEFQVPKIRGANDANTGLEFSTRLLLAKSLGGEGAPSAHFRFNTIGAAMDASQLVEIQNDGTQRYRMRGDGAAKYGTGDPDGAALLELDSTTHGFLIMRMTGAQAVAITAVNGLIVYATSTSGAISSVGFWGYEAGAWVKL